jgi:diguanylate cyclase (GGDEF)-like protein
MNELPMRRTTVDLIESDITDIAIIYDISMIAAITNLDYLIKLVLEKATRTLCSDMSAIVLYENNCFKTIGCKGALPEAVDFEINGKYSKLAETLLSKNNFSYEILCGEDNPEFSGTMYNCLLFKPIKLQENIMGLIIAGRAYKNNFSLEEIRFYSLLAQKAFSCLENIRLKETLYLQSITDSLTGLYNSRYLDGKISKALTDAQHQGVKITLIMMDFLGFKEINDALGHKSGDFVLEEFGKFLLDTLGKGNDCFRVGGDEFLVVLYNYPDDDLDNTCSKIKSFAKADSFSFITNQGIEFGLDIGYAKYPYEGTDFETLYNLADKRMYKDKAKSRKRLR